MDLKVFAAHELTGVLRALRSVAAANDRFTEAERDLLEGVARIHELDVDADALEPISLEELAGILVDPHRRKRAVQLAIVTALVEGNPSAETERSVRRLAVALGIDEEGLQVLYQASRGRALLARIDMFRRTGRSVRNVAGFPGILGFALPMLGLGGADDELVARYRTLEHCAAGTLGRAIHDHFEENGFKYPGELGGFPAVGVFHDIGHVLSGYGTDPHGEIQQAAFQAGFVRRDGFTFLLFGILQFHLGMRITPVAKGYHGFFDVPLVLEALRRGACCRVDLTEGYDLFGNKDRLLDDIRHELGIPMQDARREAS
jgi:hypothetical protein